jgi:cytoskeleton protein RodZ
MQPGVAMSGIGTKLREERLRRGLDLARVEADTRIRVKYLRALEDDRFEVLPGDAYVRAFLRDYAEELGLDGQALVDELNEVTGPPEEVVLTPPRTAGPLTAPWAGRGRAIGGAALVVLAVAAALAAGLALAGASGGPKQAGPGGPGTSGSSSAPSSSPTSAPPPSSTASPPPPPAPSPVAAFALAAASGPCWVEVRLGSQAGPVLFSGTLQTGQVRHFRTAPLWIRVGAPWNLDVRAAGRRLTLPLAVPGNVLLTRRGVTTA